jgi:predicted DNA binding protein
MISARFWIELPETLWVTELSQQYPQATFRLLSGNHDDSHAVELGEVIAEHPNEIVDVMRSHPSISNYELLESAERLVLGKYKTNDTQLYEFVEAESLTIEFPVVVQNGWYEFDLTGTRDELDTFQGRLDAAPLSYELQWLITERDADELLTDRQQEILSVAIRQGYFEVPRECTLGELGETLAVDKSTVSTVLRRAESRVLKWFMTRDFEPRK